MAKQNKEAAVEAADIQAEVNPKYLKPEGTIKAPNGQDVPADATKAYYKDWSLEDMEGKEKVILDEISAAEADIRTHEYDLPPKQNSNRSRIGQWVTEFIGRTEVTWEYTKGLLDLMEFWRSSHSKISYGYFDSTVRLLGQLKYKGEDCRKVVEINEYFQTVRPQYAADINRIVELSYRHSAVVEAMQDYKKLNGIVDEQQENAPDFVVEA